MGLACLILDKIRLELSNVQPYAAAADIYCRLYKQPPFREVSVKVFWGTTGSGKSHKAWAYSKDYNRNCPQHYVCGESLKQGDLIRRCIVVLILRLETISGFPQTSI